MHLYFYFTYNSSALVGSTFGATWEDPEGGLIKFVVKRALQKTKHSICFYITLKYHKKLIVQYSSENSEKITRNT